MRHSVRESMGSSFNHRYETPDYLLKLVRELGTIAVDPATSKHNPVRALEWCTRREHGTPEAVFKAPKHGGLGLDWHLSMRSYASHHGRYGHCVLYINSPYGLLLKQKFAPKIALEGNRVGTWSQIALVPARVDTAWFELLIRQSRPERGAVCYWNSPTLGRRLTFRGAKDPAFFPSALVYWGSHRNHFEQIFRPHGTIVRCEHFQFPAADPWAQPKHAMHAACP